MRCSEKNRTGEKNPTPVGHGIKDSIVAMDQGGSNIVSGGAGAMNPV